MWLLSFVIGVSYLISAILYEDYIISVWCFFASLISIVIYFFVRWIPSAEDQRARIV
jgi:hypothetical protein